MTSRTLDLVWRRRSWVSGKPLGLVALVASQAKPSDDVVAKAYVPLTTPVEKQKRRARYESGVIKADDGTEIFTLQIAGWQ